VEAAAGAVPSLASRKREGKMYLIVHWLLSALSLLVVARVVPGFRVADFGTALVAAIVIGLINATVGFFLKVLTFPITIVTFGLFLFVINAIVLRFASSLVSGFVVVGFGPAFVGAIVLSLVNLVLRRLVLESAAGY
jgi:putative membrane protein